ncbi:MAG: hypothetical protein JWM56_1209 [Candidatus Peribacteria bacterium]|nr:hypothetical protein [Candidatus Peribacteria bacterium]
MPRPIKVEELKRLADQLAARHPEIAHMDDIEQIKQRVMERIAVARASGEKPEEPGPPEAEGSPDAILRQLVLESLYADDIADQSPDGPPSAT